MGNRTPGSQGLAAGGSQSPDSGTLIRARSCTPTPTNKNTDIKQETSWALGQGQTPRHRDKIGQIFFATKSFRLDGNDRAMLGRLCAAIIGTGSRKGHGAALLVVGSADHRGDAGYNLRLAARRAISVRRYIQGKLPGAVIWARTLGEALAEQPEMCRRISQQTMAEERRVDIIYGKYQIVIGENVEVVIPTLGQVIKDAERIVGTKTGSHPNQSRRLLCYLSKLKGAATVQNDSYWSYGDWLACWKTAYKYGRFSSRGVATAGDELRKRRQSARQFLKNEVALKNTDDQKFSQLLLLDTTLFNSAQKVADRLDSSGIEKVFPYWIAVRSEIAKMIGNSQSLYSCLEGKARSFWQKYIPV